MAITTNIPKASVSFAEENGSITGTPLVVTADTAHADEL